MERAPDRFGDGIEEASRRRHGSDVSVLEWKRVRLRFGPKDRVLYLDPVWGVAPAARDCHASCSQHIAATLTFGSREAGTSAVAALA